MCINKETAVEGATLGRQKNGRTPTRKKKNKRGTRQMERKMEDDWRTRWRRRPPDVRNRITGGRGERRDARRSFSFGASFLAFSSSVLGLSHHPSLRDGVCAAGDGFFFAGFFFGVIILFILLSWLLFYRLRSSAGLHLAFHHLVEMRLTCFSGKFRCRHRLRGSVWFGGVAVLIWAIRS